MADPTPPPAGTTGGLTVPDEVQKKFGDLIALITGSESMNAEERQYWVNILPIMTPEQIQNLRDILDNEKKQLAAIDEKYTKEVATIGQSELIKKTEEERRKKREQRSSQEASHKQVEDKQTEDLLKQIESTGGKAN